MKALDIDPIHDTQACYRRLVEATSRPGTVRAISPTPADRTILATLVDTETTLYTDDERLREALAGEGRFVDAPLADADVVHVRGDTGGAVAGATRGTLKEPSRGATVVYRVETVAAEAGPETTAVTLSGPGVPGERSCGVALSTTELDALADAQADYPRGVDAYITDGERVVAFPRSTSFEAGVV